MMRVMVALLAISSPAAPASGADDVPARSDAAFNPRAVELFERDWILNRWGVKHHDRDGNGIISVAEANAAAAEFKAIADGNRDGRVTPYEYDRAREFIIARY